MANFPFLLSILLLTITLTSASAPSPTPTPITTQSPPTPSPSPPPPSLSPPPPPSPSPPPPSPPPPSPPPPSPSPPPPSPPPPASLPSQELTNIIEALIGASDFTNWANIISMINPLTLPLSATLFIPQDDRNGESLNMGMDMGMDPFILPYHIIPQRLTFSDLQLLNTNTRLPTLLTAKTILITNTSASNFTLDDSPITQPDVYTTNAVTVHGIATLLDYNIYGDNDSLNVPLPIPPPPPQLQDIPPAPPFAEAGSTTSSHDHDHDHDHYHYHAYSHAARLFLWSSEFSIVFLNIVLSAGLAFNIHQD